MRNEHGFTLTELLAAMAVLGLLMAGLFATLRSGQATYGFGAARAEVQQNARVGLDRMLHELRTGTKVTAASASSLTFEFVNGTGDFVTVQYSLSGTDLRRNQTAPAVAGQPETLIGGVSALAITYYDGNNVLMTAPVVPASVCSVDVTLTVLSEGAGLTSASPSQRQAMVQGRVKLRNR
jgi:prepilin-type N-terminal cleavage/methylation domain-containing protein